MVVEVLLHRLPVPALVLPDIGPSVGMEIVLSGLEGSFQGWQVVLRYLQKVVRISEGGIPCCCR